MKKLLVAFFTFLSLASQAQTIKGIISSAKDKSAIDFATVALLHMPDSAVITGISTKSGGLYAFENVKPGNYYLKASFLGYQPNGRQITVNPSDKVITVDSISITEASTQIGDATVIGKKIEGKEMVDRTVYSIPYEVSKASPNAYDLLKKVPSLQVDYNDKITLNGSSNFIIQVDGKQRDKEFLARIQPTDIETIEVITNPSGKYEGNIDGIINVKLKQEARHGISGNINAGARPRAQTSANINGSLDYALGKATVYVTGYGFSNDLNIKNQSDLSLNRFDSFTNKYVLDSIIKSSGSGKYTFFAGAINGGVDYYIDKYKSFSFNTSYKPLTNVIDVTNDNNISKIGLLDTTFYSGPLGSKTTTKSGEINSSIFYKQQFAKPMQELTLELTYYRFNQNDIYDNNRSFKNIKADTLIDKISRTENSNSLRNSINFKTDYTHPLGFDSKIETGVQFYWQQINFTADLTQSSTVLLPHELSYSPISPVNNLKYTEWRQAVYLGYSTVLGKFNLQGMLRFENSIINAKPDTSFNYFELLPTVNFMYKLTQKQNLKLTYNRRINRPSLTQLSPVQIFGATDMITSGNPKLKPEIRDRFQLTYTLNIDKSYISPYVYYDFYNDKVDNLNYRVPAKINQKINPLAVAKNLLTGDEKGVGLNAMVLFLNVNFKYYQSHFNEFNQGTNHIDAKTYDAYSISGWAFAPLPKKISAFVFANYQSMITNAQGSSVTPFFYGAGARKEIGNHTIGMFYLLPGITNLTVFDNKVSNSYYESRNKASFDARYFIQITYSYKFSKGKAAKKIVKNIEVESDTKKGAMGN